MRINVLELIKLEKLAKDNKLPKQELLETYNIDDFRELEKDKYEEIMDKYGDC